MDKCYNWNFGSMWCKDLPDKMYVGQWPLFHGPVILPCISKTIWWTNVIVGILDPCDAKINDIKHMWVSDLHFMVQWFWHILKPFWWRNVGLKILIQCAIKFDLQIYMKVSDLYFVVQWFCLIFSILFDEQASFFGYWFWCGLLNHLPISAYVMCWKFDMKIFVNVARLEIGQLTQCTRQGHPCTF